MRRTLSFLTLHSRSQSYAHDLSCDKNKFKEHGDHKFVGVLKQIIRGQKQEVKQKEEASNQKDRYVRAPPLQRCHEPCAARNLSEQDYPSHACALIGPDFPTQAHQHHDVLETQAAAYRTVASPGDTEEEDDDDVSDDTGKSRFTLIPKTLNLNPPTLNPEP